MNTVAEFYKLFSIEFGPVVLQGIMIRDGGMTESRRVVEFD